MPRITLSAVSLAVTLLCSFALQAQQPAPRSSTITLNVVTSPAAETLTAADFSLLDNKAPRQLTSARRVSAGMQQGTHVIVVVDAVNTPYSRTAYERSQVQKFLQANGGHLDLPTTFAVVADRATNIQQGFSTDGNALSAALGNFPFGLREVRRDQGIYGADERTQISLRALDQLTAYAAKIPGPKLVLWVSPGWPLLSGIRVTLTGNQQKAIFSSVVSYSQRLREAGVTLYSISPFGPEEDLLRASEYEQYLKGVAKPSDTYVADLSLQVLAAQTGGLTFISNSDVAGNLQKCVQDTRSWYEISFPAPPAEHANEYHQVEVKVAKPGISARTRDGYYAQP